jgi:hypothetical protein
MNFPGRSYSFFNVGAPVQFGQIERTVYPFNTTDGLSAGTSFGDTIFFGGCSNGNPSTGMIALRVNNTTGENCAYTSSDWQGLGKVTGRSNQQLSPAGYSCEGIGVFYSGVIPPTLEPNTVKILEPFNVNPSPPCGVGVLTKTFYDNTKNLVAFEYDNSFAEDYFCYAAIHQINNFGLSGLVNGGFIGLFTPGNDGFDRTSLNLPPYVTDALSVFTGGCLGYQSGSYYYDSSGSTGYPANGTIQNSIVQGGNKLSCDTSLANTQTYVVSSGGVTTLLYENTPDDYISMSDVKLSCQTQNPRIFMVLCTSISNDVLRIFSEFFIVDVVLDCPPNTLSSAYLYNDGTVIALGLGISNTDTPIPVYKLELDLIQYGIYFTAVVQTTHNGVINGNRPISPKGQFIT